MSIKNPSRPEDVTPEWLTHALRSGGAIKDSSVTSLKKDILGVDKGFLSSVVKSDIEYDTPEPGAPASVVVKLETESPDFKEFGDDLHAFQREIKFYKNVAPSVPVRLPKFYYGVDEPPHYSLVLEDLSSYIPGDQVEGMHPGQVTATAEMMARIQAPFWNNQALQSLDWMPHTNGMASDYLQKWESFEEHFGHLCDPRGLEIGSRLRGYLDWKGAEVKTRPKTIVHFDLREDNLMFGSHDSESDIIILDWQLAMKNIGAFDVARLIAGSEIPKERQGHEFEVLRVWHDTLLKNGVTAYSWDDAVYDFKLGTLSFICAPVHFHTGAFGITGRAKELVDVMYSRVFKFVAEIDAGSILPD